MSILIQIDESANSMESYFGEVNPFFKSCFKHRFNCHRITDQSTSTRFYIRSSMESYRLTTIWDIKFVNFYFLIEVTFYNSAENDFLRAHNERMKLQITLLMIKINKIVQMGMQFCLDIQTGRLKFCYQFTWNQFLYYYHSLPKFVPLLSFIIDQLQKFDYLIMFLEPHQLPQHTKPNDVMVTINKFKALFRNTPKFRQDIQNSINSVFQIKRRSTYPSPFQQTRLREIELLYLKNITDFQQHCFSLEEIDPIRIDQQLFAKQLKEVKKNSEVLIGRNQNPKEIERKILTGIKQIIPSKKHKSKLISGDGSHSYIYMGVFKLTLIWSITQGTTEFIDEENSENTQLLIQKKSEPIKLIYKECKKPYKEESVNSFLNEIEVIKFLRFKYHYSIAQYYLEQKNQWNEKDIIYMKYYSNLSLNFFLKNHVNSFRKKLEIAYLISKGLCFLYKSRICHRDLKPQNIVISSCFTPKIIDFGSSIAHYKEGALKVYDSRLLTTPGFHVMYDEIPLKHIHIKNRLKRDAYEQHPLFDVYSFGKVLNYIFFGDISQNIELDLNDPHLIFLDHILFCINSCLAVDPDDRPNFSQITAYLGSVKNLLQLQNMTNKTQQSQKEEQSQNLM